MTLEVPDNTAEKKEILDDNARKFIVNGDITTVLTDIPVVSYQLITDWLQTEKDYETKLARKEFDNGETQILFISKVIKDGDRTSVKEKLSEGQYNDLLHSTLLHLAKRRREFEYTQGNTAFSLKFDEFADSELKILEVDASSEKERLSFSSADFPVALTEVTGQVQYYGYRVAAIV